MRHVITSLLMVALGATALWGEERTAASPTDAVAATADATIPYNIPEPLDRVLNEINSIGPYQSPKLSLRYDDRYAHTSESVVPFGGVEPFKKHFLLQMEYTGAGRAIPEDRKSVV